VTHDVYYCLHMIPCCLKQVSLDEIMDLIIFGFKTNMRQIWCYICPGWEDNKSGTNMFSYLSLINAGQMLFEIEAIFSQSTKYETNQTNVLNNESRKLRPWWVSLYIFFFCRIPTCLQGLFEFPFFVPLRTGADLWVVDWVVS